MRKTPRGRKNTSQINEYIQLGVALQRHRSTLKQEAVDAVLRSRAGLRDKIERINRIDQADERYAPLKGAASRKTAGEEPDSGTGQVDEADQKDILQARRNQLKLVRFQVESRLVRFIFREYGRLKRFGAKTGVLAFRFPWRVRLAKEALGTIASDVARADLHAVIIQLDQIIQTGWHVLEKHEYNSIVLLAQFCRCVSDVTFRALDCNDRFLIGRLKDLERLYLVFHGAPDVPEAVFAAFAKIIDQDPPRADPARKCAGNVQALLAESDNRPTLGNLILGLNMLRWRRYLTMPDLADVSAGTLVCRTVLDCPDDVRPAVNRFIEEQEARLKTLVRERAGLAREIDFFPADSRGEIVYGDLIRFYSRQADPDQTGSWKRDSEQVLFFLVRIIELFLFNFRPLLCGILAFEPSGSGGIFDSPVFDADFDLLSRSLKQLERHAFSYGSMSRSRYQEIQGTHKTATRIEAEAFSLITDILSRLHAIAQRIVLHLAGPEAAAGGNAIDPPSTTGPSPVAHGNEVIRGRGVIAGKTVLESLRYAAAVAYGIGLYLLDPALWGILNREAPLKAEFAGVMRSLKRVAPVRVFNEIQKKYVLLQ